MRRRLAAALCMLGCLCVLGGCGKEDAEVAVPQVEVVEEPQISQTEEQKEAELGLDTQAGTELGEEEITVMTDEGESETAVYTRVRGIGDFSIAYDAEEFTLTASENELRFEPVVSGAEGTETGAGTAGDAQIFLSIRTEEAPSAEELADQYVAESNEECTVEEMTVGEGEYPAIWVSYAEGTDAGSRTCDLYIFRYNDVLYVAQLDCTVEAYDSLGASEHTILSTLRFDEG